MTARAPSQDPIVRFAIAIGWMAAFAVAGALGTLVLSVVLRAPAGPWGHAADAAARALGFFAATWVVGQRLAHRTWSDLGWRSFDLRDLARTVLRRAGLGAGAAAVAVVLAVALGGARLGFTPDWVRYADVALPVAIALLCAALFEELLFRGFPLRTLSDVVGAGRATLVLAVGFAVAHVFNPGTGFIGIVNVALAGLWLSLAFFSPGGMAAAWGLHFGWNAGLALLFDAPVSGLKFNVPVVEYDPGRLAFIDGGRFGPEGGVVASIAFVAAAAVLVGGQWRRAQRWLDGVGGTAGHGPRRPAGPPPRPEGARGILGGRGPQRPPGRPSGGGTGGPRPGGRPR